MNKFAWHEHPRQIYIQKLVGRFKSNTLVLHHCRLPRDECDSGTLSGSLAAFKFAIDSGLKNPRSDSFRKEYTRRPLLLFQKMRGWLRVRTAAGSLLGTHEQEGCPRRLRSTRPRDDRLAAPIAARTR